MSRNTSQDAPRCVCVRVFWVEMGACLVLIRQHGGHACGREPTLASPRHQLSYLASSNGVPTATWHAANSADSQPLRSVPNTGVMIHLFPNRKCPLILGRLALLLVSIKGKLDVIYFCHVSPDKKLKNLQRSCRTTVSKAQDGAATGSCSWTPASHLLGFIVGYLH